jgi:LPXTG-motif cell wall-anchored protein
MYLLAAETAQEGQGVNLVVVALVLLLVALAVFAWRRRQR